MIDLQANSGLPLLFDEVSEKFRYGEGIVYEKLNRVPLASMLPGLLNKSLKYPETVYLEHQNIRHQNDEDFFKDTNLHYDVVMLPSGLMGVEFIRSHIFYADSCDPETGKEASAVSEIVECLSGMVTILLQKNAPKGEWDFETRVSEGLVVRLKDGEKFIIPRGYYYTFINTRVRPVVFSRFYSKNCVCDYSKFRYEQGLAYFAIRKNAKQEIVLNPRYREIPEIQKVASEVQVCKRAPELTSDPLYVQIKNSDDKFFSLF